MPTPAQLLENNRRWAESVARDDADFFPTLAAQQQPGFFWIGCADSRVPANQIVGLAPGEVFVHRNVANLVVHTDLNCLSALQYAVEVLQVGHVIVCGHYGCGGVCAAWEGARFGLIDNWLRHIEDVAERHMDVLRPLEPRHAQNRLCELNVIEQVRNVARTTIVQDAWGRGQELAIHGWIYALDDGRLRDLEVTVSALGEIDQRAQAAVRALSD
ncbi:MAG: carbonate dehydratase [Candidatus Dadabacteria bacterium]|nr:MAG: carbonate dehydratase [Candidatus Dadabacteria bacterium]